MRGGLTFLFGGEESGAVGGRVVDVKVACR